jgi:UDP-hydrolysing UDP-N-acetyl-D-glucosamine 2-epimerase
LHTSAVMSQYGDVSGQLSPHTLTRPLIIRNALAGGDVTAMVKTTGLAMVELASAFEEMKPDVVVTIADRFETLATAAAAAYMNIPLAHLQGGEQTGSIDDKVRNAISMLADTHYAATEKAGKRLKAMGVKGKVVVTGCPSIDLLTDVPAEFPTLPQSGVGPAIDPGKPFLLVCQHPVTTEHQQAYEQMRETLKAVVKSGLQAIWIHPNIDAGTDGSSKAIREFHEQHPAAPIHWFRNLPPHTFAQLMRTCACMVGNSSAALREGAYLGTPAVNIGSRQKHREHGANVAHVSHHELTIRSTIHEQCDHGFYERDTLYGDGESGGRIAVHLVESYRPDSDRPIGMPARRLREQ